MSSDKLSNDFIENFSRIAEEAHSVTEMRWAQYGGRDDKVVSALELSDHDGSIISGGLVAETNHPKLAEYISKIDPQNLLLILSELKSAREKLSKIESSLKWYSGEVHTDIREDYSNSFSAIKSSVIENILKS